MLTTGALRSVLAKKSDAAGLLLVRSVTYKPHTDDKFGPYRPKSVEIANLPLYAYQLPGQQIPKVADPKSKLGLVKTKTDGYPAYLKDVPDMTPGIMDGYSPMGHKILSRQEHIDTWNYVNSVYFGPDRDHKNYPNPSMPYTNPETRLGIFSAKLFDNFYNTTGVSGPYVLGFGFFVWMHSMEYNVLDHDTFAIPSFFGAIYLLHCHPKTRKMFADLYQDMWDTKWKNLEWDKPLGRMRASAEKDISKLNRLIEECETHEYLKQAKEEGVALQLEASYRSRMLNAFQEVKKRLDYEAQKVNIKKRFEQEHMVNWIVNSVQKGITPQQEKDSIKNCLAQLKSMSATQKVSVA